MDQELLRAYLDEMYLGRLGSQEILGLRQGSRVLIPAGSVVRGVVNSASSAGRVDRLAA